MSTTSIYKIRKNGTPAECGCVSNSWRFAMALWVYLEDKYLPMYRGGYVTSANWYTEDISDSEIIIRLGFRPSRLASFTNPSALEEVWKLFEDDRLTKSERIALGCTFDEALIHKEAFPRVIEAFRSLTDMQNSAYPELADILENLLSDDDCIGAGFGISQSECLWECAYDENDEEILYNVFTGDKHFWLDEDNPALFD